MPVRRRLLALMSCLVLASSSAGFAQDRLDGKRATAIVEAQYDGKPICYYTVAGEHKVFYPGRGETDYAKHVISAEEHNWLEVWSRLGLLIMQSYVAPAGQSFLTGIHRIIRLTPTPKAEALHRQGGCSPVGIAGAVVFPMYTPRFGKLVSHEVQTRGANKYLIARLTSSLEWTDVGFQSHQAMKMNTWRNVKVIMLLKYDAFSDKWILAARDVAEANGDFTTNNVDRYLSQLPR